MKHGYSDTSPYAQPLPGYYPRQILHGLDEEVDYLPGTHIRVWFTHLPTAYPQHRHACMEIIEGVHAHYRSVVGGQPYTVGPGEVLIIPPGILHDLTPDQDCNGWIYLCDLGWIQAIPSGARLQRVLRQPFYISQAQNPTLFMDVTSQLSRMRGVYFSQNADRELLFDAELLQLLTCLNSREAGEAGARTALDKRQVHSPLFIEAIEYIEQNFSRELTLDALAHRFNLSSAYFSRLFSHYVRESFSDYLTHRRLREAERLLTDTTLSVTEVALRCGYTSPAAFTRAFQAQHDCTPSQFRRIYVQFLRRGG